MSSGARGAAVAAEWRHSEDDEGGDGRDGNDSSSGRGGSNDDDGGGGGGNSSNLESLQRLCSSAARYVQRRRGVADAQALRSIDAEHGADWLQDVRERLLCAPACELRRAWRTRYGPSCADELLASVADALLPLRADFGAAPRCLCELCRRQCHVAVVYALQRDRARWLSAHLAHYSAAQLRWAPVDQFCMIVQRFEAGLCARELAVAFDKRLSAPQKRALAALFAQQLPERSRTTQCRRRRHSSWRRERGGGAAAAAAAAAV